MKKIIRFIWLAFLLLSFHACELDNYDGPNASVGGTIIDKDTKQPIEQDIIRGTQIIFVELGYDNPAIQSMAIKNDGTYMNSSMFAGRYNFYFNESNFVQPEKLESYEIKKGNNELNYEVQPYIRISDVSIRKIENKIVSTFKVSPTVENKLKKVALFAHVDNVVGDAFKTVESTLDVNAKVEGSQIYTLEIDLSTANLKSGTQYYFRVGALIDAVGAKYNYAPAVRLAI